jgi:hypothetical protein
MQTSNENKKRLLVDEPRGSNKAQTRLKLDELGSHSG